MQPFLPSPKEGRNLVTYQVWRKKVRNANSTECFPSEEKHIPTTLGDLPDPSSLHHLAEGGGRRGYMSPEQCNPLWSPFSGGKSRVPFSTVLIADTMLADTFFKILLPFL
ncbi:MAG: hypothetical protein HYZ69_00275 [Candidatus Colwellbacteria bacterium]|nr:hypothetical protein [Candidatus Colwellbacteria bacterium]